MPAVRGPRQRVLLFGVKDDQSARGRSRRELYGVARGAQPEKGLGDPRELSRPEGLMVGIGIESREVRKIRLVGEIESDRRRRQPRERNQIASSVDCLSSYST